jgi:PHD/YefM family antitoxin component YafN of YafNO toxin-antitoxin module
MKQINTIAFRSKLTSLLDEIFFHGERYEIMKGGKKRAVVMSVKEYEELIEYVRICDKRREIK